MNKIRNNIGQFSRTPSSNWRTLVGVSFIILVLLIAIIKRNQNSAITPEVVPQDASVIAKALALPKNSILSEEEKAQVLAQQELMLKEAENLKIRDMLLTEKAQAIADYDKKLEEVENALSTIRGDKLGFQPRPRQNESQRQSTKQNAVVTVSVVDREDLARLVTISSSNKLGETTR